jgi:hypothetical protein
MKLWWEVVFMARDKAHGVLICVTAGILGAC